MAAITDLARAHGCGCGVPGLLVSSESLEPPYLTGCRLKIVVEHESGYVHVNEYDPKRQNGPRLVVVSRSATG